MGTKNQKKLFGTDGVRGRANHDTMTVETALALGRAVGCVFRRHNGKHRVVIGKDTRLSCYMFENALIAGLCSMGVDTLMVGPLPTPGVAFITRAYRADAGIMISASHNSFQDNGIKIFSAEGYKLPDSMEREIEELVYANEFDRFLPGDTDIGKNTKVDDAAGRYIEFVKATFPKRQSLDGVVIALDCANGAGYRVASHIFRELDAEVYTCGMQPNGLNINLDCGALHPAEVQKLVIDKQANVGIALDGDADRVILVDENAQVVDGDAILAICAADMKEKGILRNNRMVATVMSNIGLKKAMQARGIDLIEAKVGDRYVIEQMRENDCNLGGEQSGHLIFSDYNSTGDALVCALQVLRIMKETGQKLSQLAKIVTRYPQALINVSVSSKPALGEVGEVSSVIKRVEGELGDSGRVLIRYSGTENICRVMVEGAEQRQVDEWAGEIADQVRVSLGA